MDKPILSGHRGLIQISRYSTALIPIIQKKSAKADYHHIPWITLPSLSFSTIRHGKESGCVKQNLNAVMSVDPVGVSRRFRAAVCLRIGASPNRVCSSIFKQKHLKLRVYYILLCLVVQHIIFIGTRSMCLTEVLFVLHTTDNGYMDSAPLVVQ